MQKYFREMGYLFICLLLVAILLLAFLWALSIGTVKLPLAQIYTVIVDQLQSDLSVEAAGRGAAHDIVWLLRLPRLVLAAAVGCGLACYCRICSIFCRYDRFCRTDSTACRAHADWD